MYRLGKVLAIALLSRSDQHHQTVAPDLTAAPAIYIRSVGVSLAWISGEGLLSTLELLVCHVVLDYLVTGIVTSRGANIVHDLAKTLSSSS